MRVLGVGYGNDLGDIYLRLSARGHEVRTHVEDVDSRDVLEGMIPRTSDWRGEVAWVKDGGGLIVFEGTGWGEAQDALRRQGHRVVGGSALGDRLELDRLFGQRALHDVGLRTAPVHEFCGFDAAIAWVARKPARYVLKFSGPGFASTRSYVGSLEDGRDMLAVLRLQKNRWTLAEVPTVILMRHLQGVEVGVGAFFNGSTFVGPTNLDWEHKRFFPGDLGELTGEMGTVVTCRGADKLFDATLGRMALLFRQARHVGYVNLNLIVNDEGPWPLELTCRFGYPGFAILGTLYEEPWDAILSRLADGSDHRLATSDGFAVGVVLTVPPFPYREGYERLSKGAAICFREELSAADREGLHYGEVKLDEGQLVTAGQIGYVMVATGRGSTIEEARTRACSRADKVIVPNVRYRTDIGRKLEIHDHAELVRLGWMT